MSGQRAIVIGATSGIGRELAKILMREGYSVGLTGRRVELLKSLQEELPGKSWMRQMDIAETDAARDALRALIDEMGGVDLIIINAGISSQNNPAWEREKQIIDINVAGFVAMANAAMSYFIEKGGGHIVGVSSIAGIKGVSRAAAYSSSKAFISTYMQAMRSRSNQKQYNITFTDILPGFIETPMTDGRKGMFWLEPLDKATEHIWQAIRKKKRRAYITKRWILVAFFLKMIPDWLYVRLPV